MELDSNPVISKVRKLLALAATGSGATEAEASNAAAMVQDILQKHGLTMMQVEAAGGTAGSEGKRGKAQTDRRALFLWQQKLMKSLAENNFCIHFVERVAKHDGRKMRKSKQHVLIGRWVNVQTTLHTYDYLCKAVKRAADEEGYFHEAETEKQHHMFLESAVDRLARRLVAKRREAELAAMEERAAKAKAARAAASHPGAAPVAPGTALVLTDVYTSELDANEDLRWGRAPGETARQRAVTIAMDAKWEQLQKEGVEWAKAFFLSRGMDEEAAERRAKAYNKKQEREQTSYTRADARSYARQTSEAYQRGDARARDIGLDTQIGNDQQRKLG